MIQSGKKRKRLGEMLIDAGLIKAKDLEDALALQKVQDKKLGEILTDMGIVDDESIARAISTQLGILFVRLKDIDIPKEILSKVSPEMAEKYSLIPFQEDEESIMVTMANPLELQAVTDLRFITQKTIIIAVSPIGEVLDSLAKFYPKEDLRKETYTEDDSIEEVDYLLTPKGEDKSDLDLANLAVKAPVIRFTNAVLADSIKMGASDIHIEPQKSMAGKPSLIIRCRVDGIMRETMNTDMHVHASLVSRIKIISGLDISIRRKPQDGKAQVKFGGDLYDLRVSTIPTTYGEKVTIRILNPASVKMSLDDLGFSEKDNETILQAIETPQGIILVTGPTGSGKSSTLVAFLNRLNTPEVNIITVEDPVEFDIPGINQVQINVKAGITFAAGLRSILRQDPDIVLVGEIRDGETAKIGFEAAQTGHLVLSTLHTNDAPATVTRLLDLGIDDFQISSALISVLGQRLVRRIHNDCKAEVQLDERVAERIRHYFNNGNLPTFWKGEGCKGCFNTGYLGRLGVYEVLAMTPTLRTLITPTISSTVLKDAAKKEGFQTLSRDGIFKAVQGLTTVEEVFRVAPPEIRAAGISAVAGVPVENLPADEKISKTSPHLLKAMAKLSPLEEPLAFADESSKSIPDDAPLVVVVDDNEIIRLTICSLMETEGYRVLAAESGEEALEVVSEEKPDLIVTDYMMPGMDGVALIQKLKGDAGLNHIPIIMLTAKTDVDSQLTGIKAGADEYLTKPVNRDLFLVKVEKLLSK